MAHFGRGSVPIGIDDVYCNGTESTLTECRHITSHNCGHHEDAGVTCSQGTFEHETFRCTKFCKLL